MSIQKYMLVLEFVKNVIEMTFSFFFLHMKNGSWYDF